MRCIFLTLASFVKVQVFTAQQEQSAQALTQTRLEARAPPPLPAGAPARHAGSKGAGTRTHRPMLRASLVEKGIGGGSQTL